MRFGSTAVIFNIVITLALAEKGNRSVNEVKMKDTIQRLLRKKRHQAIKLGFHAIVAEDVTPNKKGDNRVWKGTGYGSELNGKGKKSKGSKSSKSKKDKSRKDKSRKSNKTDLCQHEYVGKGKGSSSYYSGKGSSSSSSSSSSSKGKGSDSGDEPAGMPTSTPSCSVSPASVTTSSPRKTLSPSPTNVPTITSLPTSFVTDIRKPSAGPSSIPTSFPSIQFDLQVCESYSRVWIVDLSKSCDEFLDNCQCPDAQRLVDDGKIICGVDSCPPGCSVCTFCLEDIINCTPAPTSKPSVRPSWNPTKNPSVLPTVAPSSGPSITSSLGPSASPSLGPSGSPTSEPSSLFDLQDCNTYAEQWLVDLVATCEASALTDTCQCTDARARIDSGQIHCGVAQCPDDCEVCKYCLYEIEGCPWLPTAFPTVSPVIQASDKPSMVPTLAPVENTSSPSGAPSEAPTPELFDLSTCSDYSGLWQFDLIVNGKCTTAETLMEQQKLTCESECPDGCAMCDLCLDAVLDCVEPTSQPSPSIVFDLDNCASYEDKWLRDVIITGICNDAIAREANGEISCREDTCPPGCAICEVCLSKISCPDTPSPSSKPTRSGQTISPHPSQTPTVSPTPEFRLDDCSSYSKLWLLDLSTTCGSLDAFEDVVIAPMKTFFNSCQAIHAERKIAQGLIQCGEDVCPENCSVCNFSLYELLGCMPAQ